NCFRLIELLIDGAKFEPATSTKTNPIYACQVICKVSLELPSNGSFQCQHISPRPRIEKALPPAPITKRTNLCCQIGNVRGYRMPQRSALPLNPLRKTSMDTIIHNTCRLQDMNIIIT